MGKAGLQQNPFSREEFAETYDSWFETPLGNLVDRLERALIFRLAQPKAGERALDVGTGTGHFACLLAKQGLQVIGLDSSEAMLRVAREKGAPVHWQRGEAEALPFPTGSFDLVLSVTTLEFVRDPAQALQEMYRVLAPGGRMVIAVLNANSPWAKVYQEEAQRQESPFRQAHFFTPEEFLALLGAYGRPRWNSSVFISPSGKGARFAPLLEWWGQHVARNRGALLVGRIDK